MANYYQIAECAFKRGKAYLGKVPLTGVVRDVCKKTGDVSEYVYNTGVLQQVNHTGVKNFVKIYKRNANKTLQQVITYNEPKLRVGVKDLAIKGSIGKPTTVFDVSDPLHPVLSTADGKKLRDVHIGGSQARNGYFVNNPKYPKDTMLQLINIRNANGEGPVFARAFNELSKKFQKLIKARFTVMT